MPRLGIDTGGTCTDAVIIDAGQVVAKRKSLTTAHDLSVGINDALAGLPRSLLESVDLVALSTTPSTNSVVEGRGAPVSVLLPGYSEAQAEKSGLYRIIEREFVALIGGGPRRLGRGIGAARLGRRGREHQSARRARVRVRHLRAVRHPQPRA